MSLLVESPSSQRNNSISVSESLLVLINSYRLKRVCSVSRQRQIFFKCLMSALPKFFKKVGHVSQRFMNTTFRAVSVVLETSILSVDTEQFKKVLSMAALLGAKLNDVYLKTDEPFTPQDYSECAPLISALSVNAHNLCSYDFQSSIFFLPSYQRTARFCTDWFPIPLVWSISC
ncbi:hypothetical protein GEMRC1_002321 [Eukaryota sp. GEM-RC1]